jgi:uncharacterized protein YydD (DUF2326 family)
MSHEFNSEVAAALAAAMETVKTQLHDMRSRLDLLSYQVDQTAEGSIRSTSEVSKLRTELTEVRSQLAIIYEAHQLIHRVVILGEEQNPSLRESVHHLERRQAELEVWKQNNQRQELEDLRSEITGKHEQKQTSQQNRSALIRDLIVAFTSGFITFLVTWWLK